MTWEVTDHGGTLYLSDEGGPLLRLVPIAGRPDFEERAAAACRLIEAAPDLRACLKWAVALNESAPWLASEVEYCASLNAIAKAGG